MRRILLTLGLLILLFGAALGFLLGTHNGLQLGVHLANDLAGESLQMEGVQGSLLGGFRIDRLSWASPELKIYLQDLLLEWSPGELWDRRLHVRQLSATEVVVWTAPDESPVEPAQLLEVVLPVDLLLDELRLERLEVVSGDAAPVEIRVIRLAGEGKQSDLVIRTLSLEHELGSASAAGTVSLRGHYPLAIGLDWIYLFEDKKLQGNTRLTGDLSELTVKAQTSGLAQVTIDAQLQELLDDLTLTLDLQTPGVELGSFSSDLADWKAAGGFTLAGKPQKLALQGVVRLDTPLAETPAELKLNLALAEEVLQLQRTRIILADSELSLEGRVELGEAIHWNLQLAGKNLDPGLFAADYPGRIQLEAASKGSYQEQVEVQVALQRLDGRLRDYPLQGQGDIGYSDGRLQLDDFRLSSGTNHLWLDGSLTDNWNLRFRFDGQDLSQLVPDVAGRLSAEGTLEGNREAPRIRASLQGDELIGGDASLSQVSGTLDYLHQADGRLALNLEALGIAAADSVWDRLQLVVSGSRSRPALNLDASGGEGESRQWVKLRAAGVLSSDFHFDGQLDELQFQWPQAGHWQLRDAAPLKLAWPQIELRAFCLQQRQDHACVDFSAKDMQTWNADLDLPGFDLAVLQPLLNRQAELQGRVSGKAHLHMAGGRIEGKGGFEVPRGLLVMNDLAEPLTIDFSKAGVEFDLGAGGLTARLSLPLGELGNLDGGLELPGWNPEADPRAQRLSGRLQGKVRRLDLLEQFVPQLAQVKGSAELEIALGGVLNAPTLNGDIATREMAFEVPDLGLVVDQAQLSVHGEGTDRLTYQGVFGSGEGQLKLDGDTRLLAEQGWPTALRLESSRFPLMATEEYQVKADSGLNISYGLEGLRVEGRVHIPEALISPREIPDSAVASSPDVVIVGGEPADAEKPLPIFAKITLSLGDKVEIKAFDLDARVEGGLVIVENPGQPTLGRGELRLVDGSYEFYGEELNIAQGKLIFGDGPVANPGLDIRVNREIKGDEKIEAGAQIAGTLRKPSFTLYSNPSIPDTEILAYITTGKSSDAMSGSAKRSLSNRALLMGSGQVLDKVGGHLGLDELKLGEGDGEESDDLALTVGTWLSPRLFMEYVASLSGGGDTVRLRYDVNDWLQIQTETGEQQAVDLFYTFER